MSGLRASFYDPVIKKYAYNMYWFLFAVRLVQLVHCIILTHIQGRRLSAGKTIYYWVRPARCVAVMNKKRSPKKGEKKRYTSLDLVLTLRRIAQRTRCRLLHKFCLLRTRTHTRTPEKEIRQRQNSIKSNWLMVFATSHESRCFMLVFINLVFLVAQSCADAKKKISPNVGPSYSS